MEFAAMKIADDHVKEWFRPNSENTHWYHMLWPSEEHTRAFKYDPWFVNWNSHKYNNRLNISKQAS